MSIVAPIAGGAVDVADVAVGQLLDSVGGRCTATLVAPHVAITAAHCTLAPPLTFVLEDGPYDVTAITAHSDFDPITLASDIAVLALDHDATLVPWSLAAFAPGVADLVTLVGFGRDDTGMFGTRHAAPAVIARLEGPRFEIDDSAACAGDSGGPAFVATAEGAAIVGIVSAGQPLCGGTSEHVRTSAYLPWVLSVAPDARHAGAVTADLPPSVAITRPGNGATMPDTFALGVHVADDYGALTAAIAIDGTINTTVAITGDDLSIPLAMAPGAHAVTVTVLDASGNATAVPLELTIEPPIHDPGTPGAACWDDTDCAAGSCDARVCSGGEPGGCAAAPIPAWPIALFALLIGARRRRPPGSRRALPWR